MSRHRSRSPLRSRTSTLLGRRDGYYGEQYDVTVRSGPWRDSEDVGKRNADGGARWDNGSSQTEEQVDHWAKFIEAIGRAEKRKVSSVSRYHAQVTVQGYDEDSARPPRQLAREGMSSPAALHRGIEMHERTESPGQRRTEHDGARADRRYARSSSPRHSQGKRHDKVDHRYHNEDLYERSSYSERSVKSNYSERPVHYKGYQDLNLQEDYSGSHRGFSPDCAPVIVEHDHGIPKHSARIHNPGRDRERPMSHDPARERGPPRKPDPGTDRDHLRSRDSHRDQGTPRSSGPVRDREHPRNRDPVSQQEHPRSHDPGRDRDNPRIGGPVRLQEHPRSLDSVRERERPGIREPLTSSDLPRDRDYSKSREPHRSTDPSTVRESSRSKELHKHGRDHNHQPGTSHDAPVGLSNYHISDDARFCLSSAERGSHLRDMPHHKKQPRMESYSREPHGQRAGDDGNVRVDGSNRAGASVLDWDEETQRRASGGVLGQGSVLKRNPQHRNPSHPGARMDFAGHETLKIKVDMSRPLHQSSLLGYSSERQLSLDLVNVGRQRLDFLPMLKHSGTFREMPVHSGTFAQEIITLLHQVKENYFQGQGMTLNERFSNEQKYSMEDEFAGGELELEGIGPVLNRPLGSTSLDTQIFCNIGPMQRKLHVAAPGDLRHDLERKRQEKLEGVKITIAGGNFSQMLPQSQESRSAYMGDEDPCEVGWSEEVPQQEEHWDQPLQKKPGLNFNGRRNFNRSRNRPGPHARRKANNARW